MFYSYKGIRPVVDPSAFVHPQAVVSGDVIIGKDVYIGPGAAIRGDFGKIIIEDGCNVQENCTIHMFPGVTVHLKAGAHIGHGAIIHGASIGKNCLVGMNAVVMDDVQVGDECIVGALAFVKAKEIIPPRSVVAGNPARVVKAVSDAMLAWKTEGTAIYQQLARDAHDALVLCEPLQESVEGVEKDVLNYGIWQDRRNHEGDARILFFKTRYTAILASILSTQLPVFGKMNVLQMIEHMAYAFRQGTGLIPLPPVGDEALRAKMLAFVRSDKPFRDNTPNQYLPDEPLPARFNDQAAALADLAEAMQGFFTFFNEHPNQCIANPFFGELNFDDCLQLLYKHALHHLRQFGIDIPIL
ncbi:MAG: transferase hexapeptide repeat family protein [Chitinophagaceae bacterium]